MSEIISIPEAIKLGAIDSQFFYREFFPKTFRQAPPAFHKEMDDALDNPHYRVIGFKCFRGSAKTTKLRARVARNISYGLTQTNLFVSNASKHSGYSLKWLRRQVDHNTRWATAFGLSKGSTWNDEHIEVYCGLLDIRVSVLALGITGQVRGINLDDFRPEFIVIDDPDNEETTRTPEQREKTSDLIFGALENSLAPPTESPNAKMVIAQTPFNQFDTISSMEKDPMKKVVTFGCFDVNGESTWATRFPTKFLKERKEGFVRLNKLSLWMREMECKIVSKETAAFNVDWLKFYEDMRAVPPGVTAIAIDPASSESKTADDQVVLAARRCGADIYLLDYTAEKGEMPDAAATTFFSFMDLYQPRKAWVEIVAYQKVLKWYLERAMRSVRKWLVVEGFRDHRKKSDRIIQSLAGLAAHGHLYVRVSHQKFIQQFTDYSALIEMHDDVLDALSIAVIGLTGNVVLDDETSVYNMAVEEANIPRLENWRVAP